MLDRRRAAFAWVCVTGIASALGGCGGGARPAHDATGAEAATTAVPVPDALAREAAGFGLTMLGDGFTWKAIDPKATRFAWSGRSESGDRELLYSFWMPKLDATESKLLPQLVASAAANLSDGPPCPPFEQPTDFVKILGVDRVISVCFEPSSYYGKELHHGILHGIVNHGALTIVAVLSNDRAAAVVPLPKSIGARGR